MERNKKKIKNIFDLNENEFSTMINNPVSRVNYGDEMLVNLILTTYEFQEDAFFDSNVNFFTKYKIFYDDAKAKVNSKILNQKKYKKTHNTIAKENPLFKKILFNIENENVEKFFWYLYVLPRKLLIIFFYMFKFRQDKISSILSDIKNYFFLIFRCGGLELFGRYLINENLTK